MTLKQLISQFDDDMLDVEVVVEAPATTGAYTQRRGLVNVRTELKYDRVGNFKPKESSIVLTTTPMFLGYEK